MSAVAPPTRFRPSLLPGPPYACAGASFLTAGVGVVAWNSVQPFAHGWWLVSFLALVGGVAQLLAGAARSALRRPSSQVRARWSPQRPTLLWGVGALLVPVGGAGIHALGRRRR